jgi:hypothetical protein
MREEQAQAAMPGAAQRGAEVVEGQAAAAHLN